VLVFCFYFIYFAQKFKWEKALEKKEKRKENCSQFPSPGPATKTAQFSSPTRATPFSFSLSPGSRALSHWHVGPARQRLLFFLLTPSSTGTLPGEIDPGFLGISCQPARYAPIKIPNQSRSFLFASKLPDSSPSPTRRRSSDPDEPYTFPNTARPPCSLSARAKGLGGFASFSSISWCF